ncbi:MAG: hypothetical protein J7L42_01400, partial [Elusimicrobia bacterium]|nr:hypothetical protein [Elusimicrobiota bacterium]
EWGDWCNNNSHWTFFTLNAPVVKIVSIKHGETGTESVLNPVSGVIYESIKNWETVEVKFSVYPSSDNCEARIYYKVSAAQDDPIKTIADDPATSDFYFQAVATGTQNYNSNSLISLSPAGGTSTATIYIPADVHYRISGNYYFWLQPCARLNDGTWLNGPVLRYQVSDDGDRVFAGRGTMDKEYPVDTSLALTNGDSNSSTYASNYTPLWHDPDELILGNSGKKYLTPQDSPSRVGVDNYSLIVGDAYQTESGSDGSVDIFYGEDPGIYLRYETDDLNISEPQEVSVVFTYNDWVTTVYAPFEYQTSVSTSIPPYKLKYDFAKAISQGDLSDVPDSLGLPTMPENAVIKYYFKIKQGSSQQYYLYSDGLKTSESGTPFEYRVLQDDYTRPFVWDRPSPYAHVGDSQTVAGRSVGYVIIKVGLADTPDGKIEHPETHEIIGPFNTWPGGWDKAQENGYVYAEDDTGDYSGTYYLKGDIENWTGSYSGGLGFDGISDSDGYYKNNVPAVNVSTATSASGVISDAMDGIDDPRWRHKTIVYYAFMKGPNECDKYGFRTGISDVKQLFQINNIDGADSHENLGGEEWDPATTVSGYVVMSPEDTTKNGNTIWFARIPIPENVREIPYLYYRIWACNGDNDPQAHNTEGAGGESTPSGGKNGTYGQQIVDPYLTYMPSGTGSGKAGGTYRDYDYGWVTRSLYAGRVAEPPMVRIISTVNFRGTKKRVVAYIKIDENTRKPAGLYTIQVTQPIEE